MSTKKIIGIVTGIVVTICLVWFAIAAAGIGSEASKMDSMLKQATDGHSPLPDLQSKLSTEGYEVKPDGTGLSAKGPNHLAVIYNTWLTVSVTGGADGLCHGYHLDRSGQLF